MFTCTTPPENRLWARSPSSEVYPQRDPPRETDFVRSTVCNRRSAGLPPCTRVVTVAGTGTTVRATWPLIDDQQRAEEALRRSEAHLSQAQRLAHVGSWVWQVAGRKTVYLSEEWYRIYGFDSKVGMPTWEERLKRV